MCEMCWGDWGDDNGNVEVDVCQGCGLRAGNFLMPSHCGMPTVKKMVKPIR